MAENEFPKWQQGNLAPQKGTVFLYNLVCERGHKRFSPTPMSFVDRQCGQKMEKGVCKKPLRLIRTSKKVAVHKPIKKRRKRRPLAIPRY